jgi:hypothetical protein
MRGSAHSRTSKVRLIPKYQLLLNVPRQCTHISISWSEVAMPRARTSRAQYITQRRYKYGSVDAFFVPSVHATLFSNSSKHQSPKDSLSSSPRHAAFRKSCPGSRSFYPIHIMQASSPCTCGPPYIQILTPHNSSSASPPGPR